MDCKLCTQYTSAWHPFALVSPAPVDKASTRGPTIYVVLRGNSKRTRLLGCSHSAHSLYGKKLSALHENPSG